MSRPSSSALLWGIFSVVNGRCHLHTLSDLSDLPGRCLIYRVERASEIEGKLESLENGFHENDV